MPCVWRHVFWRHVFDAIFGARPKFILPRESGEGNRALARWKGRGPRRNANDPDKRLTQSLFGRHDASSPKLFCDDNEASIQTPPPPPFGWSPPPLSRVRISAIIPATRARPSFADASRKFVPSRMIPSDWAGGGAGFHHDHARRTNEATEERKGSGTPRGAVSTAAPAGCGSRSAERARLAAFHHGSCQREYFIPKAQLQARLPGTRPERSIRYGRPNRGAETKRRCSGRYPRRPVPVQRAPRMPVIMPAD